MSVKAHNTVTRKGIIKQEARDPNSKTQRRKNNKENHRKGIK